MNYKIEVGENKSPAVLAIELAGDRFTATVESPAAGRGTFMGTVKDNKYEGEGTISGHSCSVKAEVGKDGKQITGHIKPSLMFLPGADFEGVKV